MAQSHGEYELKSPISSDGSVVLGRARTVPDQAPAILDAIDRRLLNEFQRNFPLSHAPYADMAGVLGISEADVLKRLQALRAAGTISRVGPVFRPNSVGVSTLAAIAVSPERLEQTAALVSAYPAVNHNYEREHRFNLWFVVTAADAAQLAAVLEDIARDTGCEVLSLPMLEDYHIDLGFELQWT